MGECPTPTLGPDALHDRPRDVGTAGDAQPGPVLKFQRMYSTGGRRDLRAALLASIAITASLLAGCSDGYIVTAGEADSAPIKTEHRMAVPAANAAIGERLASARLDDDRLSEVRGGLD